MNYLGKVLNNCKYIYNEINAATLTGAIDVVVVEQPDGSYTCSPFHVRFGKIGVLRSKEKIVDIEINGEAVDIHMKLGESGEAYFVEEVEECGDSEIPPHLACSPIPPGDETPPHWAEEGGGIVVGEEEEIGIVSESGVLIEGGAARILEEVEAGARILEEVEAGARILEGVEAGTRILEEVGVRRFRAETVGGAEERQLGQSSEFRPISSTSSDNSSKESSHDFVKEDSVSNDETSNGGGLSNGGIPGSGAVVGLVGGSGGKRKRKKKSVKKKSNTKRNSIPSGAESGLQALPSETAAIFQMEDIDINSIEHNSVLSSSTIKEEEPGASELRSVEECPIERGDIHFFSDTEITPGSSPRDDYGPVASDSEFETKRVETVLEGQRSTEEQAQSWRWGELPTPEPDDKKHDSQQRWKLGMLGFMKKTKHMRHKSEDGIYLSELNSEDPEVAALYFPNFRHNAPHHPAVDVVLEFGERSGEDDAESGNGPSLPQSPHSVEGAVCQMDKNRVVPWCEDVGLSLCGLEKKELFAEHEVSWADLASDPALVNNPKLVIKLDGKLYSWKEAAPIVVSLFVFNKPLPQEVMSRLVSEPLDRKEEEVKPRKLQSSWFNWQRQKYETVSEGDKLKSSPSQEGASPTSTDPAVLNTADKILDEEVERGAEAKAEEEIEPLTSNEKYRKTLRLSSEQIRKLKLESGANEVVFSVTTAYQGTSRCKCLLFCWRYDDKIVVSDIDGTITRSDVLGHILPIVGKDWAQSGVAKLFTKIKENGYKLLYLSARAIGQSRLTREYLKSIKQEDLSLPEGPMLLNPTSLLNAFHTEVIEKKPEEFKISCLRDIQALFPQHIKPFYAGYGNKINDVWAYQAVGIPIFRIFTINHKGELKHELTETFQSTYNRQSSIVNDIFPPRVSAALAGCIGI